MENVDSGRTRTPASLTVTVFVISGLRGGVGLFLFAYIGVTLFRVDSPCSIRSPVVTFTYGFGAKTHELGVKILRTCERRVHRRPNDHVKPL